VKRSIRRLALGLLTLGIVAGGAVAAAAGGAPSGLIFLHTPSRADGPAILLHRTSHSDKPSVLLFTAIPATLPASGGSVKLKTYVSNATSCRFSTTSKLKSLPHTSKCGSGGASITVHVAANTSSTQVVFKFGLSIKGPHGKHTAKLVKVTESGVATTPGGNSSPGPTTTSTPTTVAPAVTGDPTSETVVAGDTATFTAAASGTPTPTVQWQVSTNGGSSFSPISGATSTTYSFSASQGQSGDEYEAVFSNGVGGAATTTAATLTVETKPAVTTQPSPTTVTAGSLATFTAGASGSPTPTIQWEVSTDGGSSFSPIAGATSTTYSFMTSQSQSGDEYEAVFTNAAGSATTSFALLTVQTPPAITGNPSNETVVAGDQASFSASASGSPTPTVQWEVSTNGGSTFSNISGANSTTYSFTATAGQNGYEYEAVFSNGVGSPATTTAATLTVTPAPVAPAITGNPSNDTVVAGDQASFSASASGSPTPTVQWEVSTNGGSTFSNISGATSTTYSFTASAGQNGYEYEAVFSNGVGGPATSTAATLTVETKPVVTTNPSSETVDSGGSASFTAAASGSPAPTVQWQVSTNGGTSFSNITGATTTTYSFTASSGDAGYEYEAVFSNAAGNATTSAATLTIATAPTITTSPSNATVTAGHTATFSAAATGNPTPTVQWEVSTNGGTSFSNISGATSTTYSFTASQTESGYEYEAVFTNIANSATTSAATLTVQTAPTITGDPSNQTVAVEDTGTFTAAASGSPTPTVQWQVSTNGGSSWGNISGATSATYSFTTSWQESGYEYRAVFSNSGGTATTNAATLTLSEPQSSNWSGYVAVNGTFSSVTASWTVPTLTCTSSTAYSAHWIGIDGDTSDSVEQDGTEADCLDDSPSYDAWYEIYGDNNLDGGAEVELNPSDYPVKPGDAMNATVSVSGDVWTLAISDADETWKTFSTQVTWSGADQSSAEWIAERPEVGSSLSHLADFGSVSFTGAEATDASASGPITDFDYSPMEMIGSTNDQLANVGSLDPTGEDFTDTWYASK
jgi:hypothetical protein